MEAKPISVNRILRNILIAESVFWLLGAVTISNISPAWMQIAFVVLTFLVLGTAFLYIITRSREI
ncbi:MAG: hypothetical protein OEV85_13455 [Candidatus Thorarchaeota archaeon]|nr:hypothetical protein [Candidatus Thorarchaeota archaeon]